MRKRFSILIALVCCLVLAAGILAACNNGESTQTGGRTPGGEGIEPARLIFEKTENGYSVTGYEGAPTVVVIPETYEGLPVTSIGEMAFRDCSSLTSVVIPDSVTSIGDYAFAYCDGLTSVTIGEGVTSIGGWAFAACYGLTSVVIPDSVTSIGERAFAYCYGLTSVTIGDSVTSIGNPVFDGCYKLVEVYNKSSLNIVAGSSAYGYVGYYAKNVYTKEGGSRLTDTADGFRFFYDGAQGYLMGYNGSETDVTLPASFTAYDGTFITKYAIYDYAFSGCTSLMTSITIQDSVTSIGGAAFLGCSGLTSVTIPDGVTSIDSSAFEGCTGLTSVIIPDSVESIGASAFSYCTGLTSVTIGEGVTSMEADVFFGCSSLTSIYYTGDMASWCGIAGNGFGSIMSSGRTLYIGGNKVEGEIIIPDGVTAIPSYAFVYQTGITSVTIPDSVTSIGEMALLDCSS